MGMTARAISISATGGSSLHRQSKRLLVYFDLIFPRFNLNRPPVDQLGPDVSHEEVRATIILLAKGKMKMSAFARAFGVPVSTATRTIDRMLEKGYVVRGRSEQDRRVVTVGLSALGTSIAKGYKRRHLAAARNWLTPLSPQEREIFLKLMEKITQMAAREADHGA